MNDIIFVSMENWDRIWRRNQFLCKGLAQRFPDIKILFVGLPIDVTHKIRSGELNFRDSAESIPITAEPNILLTRPLKLLPNSLKLGRLFNEFIFRRHVLNVATRAGLKDPILWLNPHYAVNMAGKMNEIAVVYDVTDDWATLTQSSRLRTMTIDQDAELCEKASAVIVCSDHLLRMKSGLSQHVYLIPNGVDAQHYHSVLDGDGPGPAITKQWTHPILGYVGTIHPDRVDVDLVEGLARHYKDGTIALIGPDLLRPDEKRRLTALTNVKFIGSIDYEDVPAYMRTFDVCITPHVMTPFTESLNPIKLWEYLAAGKPIVSTNVAGFRDYPQFVCLANNLDEFIEGISTAIAEDRSVGEARRLEATLHSWDARIDQVVNVFERIDNRLSKQAVNA